jgi:hypothetical protein
VKRKAVVGFIMVAGLTLAGCSHSTGGSATPTPSSNSGSPTAASSSGQAVPQVANPLTVSQFEQNPCGLLTTAQANQILPSVRTRVSPGASTNPICSWIDAKQNSVGLGLVKGNGLSDAYGQRAPGDPGYFEPIPSVAGYPGVYASVSDDRSQGGCTVIVGVRNDEVLTASTAFVDGSANETNPCPLALKTAELGVATLKGGS